MVILGIDPGLATLGYGVISGQKSDFRLVQYGTITTPAGQPMPLRLRAVYQGVRQLMEIYRPDEVAFEELFFSKNITTGMAVSAARGVALLAVVEHTEELYEYTPMQIKQAVTGYGGALGAGDSILLGTARKARILSGDWSGEHYSARIWKNSNAIAAVQQRQNSRSSRKISHAARRCSRCRSRKNS